MTQTAKVIKTDDNFATVKVLRSSACAETCGHCGLCGTAQQVEAVVKNTLSAQIGDTVEIETEDRLMLSIAFVVFILPTLFPLSVYAVARTLLQTVYAVWLTALSLVVAFFTIFLLNKYVNKKYRVFSKIKRII